MVQSQKRMPGAGIGGGGPGFKEEGEAVIIGERGRYPDWSKCTAIMQSIFLYYTINDMGASSS